ncbi:hypothetical protein WJX72_008345 [[Myrmecia] bisecta]|uniref:ABC transporter domain-containing protein n=1 Tax=[Myrmecia] bisecta TaxID=41462 RepID=A0AAW1R8Y1_9CHLO
MADPQPPVAKLGESGLDKVTAGHGQAKASVEIMEPIPKALQLRLEFTSISGTVPKLFGQPTLLSRLRAGKVAAKEHQQASERQILFGITGSCNPGEVLALMGPSGSGKTSLLSVLGGRKPKAMRLSGVPHYNGAPLTKRAKRQVGFVLQDDLLYESLTGHETLYFAAMLRLPRAMTAAQKTERVLTVVTALGLDKCRDTIIGGFFRRGISGGERKRVSVGHELLINPSILLLDEPTSGLDSTTAMHLVATLRPLASVGRAVVTTIHQPSSRLYTQLDKLLLLSEGHAMYYGQASLAADWCSERFLTAHPDGYNHAGAVHEAGLGNQLWSAAQSRKQLSPGLPIQAAAPEPLSQHHQDWDQDQDRDRIASSPSASSSHDIELAVGEGLAAPPVGLGPDGRKVNRWGASYTQQLKFLFVRAVKTRRFETMSVQDIVQLLIVGLLCGLFWLQRGQSATVRGASDVTGLLFFQLVFLSFRSMFAALFTFRNEFKMMLKERASGMYRLSAFYFARTASDLPMELSLPTFYIVLMYFMSGLRLSAGAFFANWMAVMLVTLVAQSFGLLVGATVMQPKTAQTIVAVSMLAFMLVGGFYVSAIPVWISWLKYLSFVYFGYNLLIKIEFGGRTIYDCGGADVADPQQHPELCHPVPSLQQALHLQESPDAWPWEVLVLLGYLLFWRCMIYVALRRKTSGV